MKVVGPLCIAAASKRTQQLLPLQTAAASKRTQGLLSLQIAATIYSGPTASIK